MHSRLRRFRLLFTMHVGDERYMNERKVVVTDAKLELTHRFDERCRFDISDSTAKLQGERNSVNKREMRTFWYTLRRCRRPALRQTRQREFWRPSQSNFEFRSSHAGLSTVARKKNLQAATRYGIEQSLTCTVLPRYSPFLCKNKNKG